MKKFILLCLMILNTTILANTKNIIIKELNNRADAIFFNTKINLLSDTIKIENKFTWKHLLETTVKDFVDKATDQRLKCAVASVNDPKCEQFVTNLFGVNNYIFLRLEHLQRLMLDNNYLNQKDISDFVEGAKEKINSLAYLVNSVYVLPLKKYLSNRDSKAVLQHLVGAPSSWSSRGAKGIFEKIVDKIVSDIKSEIINKKNKIIEKINNASKAAFFLDSNINLAEGIGRSNEKIWLDLISEAQNYVSNKLKKPIGQQRKLVCIFSGCENSVTFNALNRNIFLFIEKLKDVKPQSFPVSLFNVLTKNLGKLKYAIISVNDSETNENEKDAIDICLYLILVYEKILYKLQEDIKSKINKN